jgi:hypothetical protein
VIVSEEEVMALARLHRGNQDWEAFSHFSHVGLITFVRAVEQASRRAALEEAAQLVGSICGNTQYSQKYARECMHKCADAIRALATETNNG